MASFRKKGNGWEASICKKGIRTSKTFDTKLAASHWAAETEKEIISGKHGEIPNKTFGDLLTRYAETVSVTKRGAQWEQHRINAFLRDEFTDVKLSHLKPEIFSAWRDRRLASVTAGTVLREINLLSHAINTAIKDWGWLKVNPLSGIRRPSEPLPRDRIITDREIEKLLFSLGYDHGRKPVGVSERVGAAMLFAIETAMRAGEIAKLTWDYVNIEKKTARLIETKNGHKRDVPLSSEAIRILVQVRSDTESVFNLEASQIDVNFRKAKDRCMIEDLHFHDLRHTAITRLASKLNVLELARCVGHRDLRQLQIYYNETAEEMAKKL
ncbi:MAG: site-specific integrase [Nitrosomonas sp.]|nr:site-specific integrase [Nitrosomonas sp.]